jgi:hypothetical protein
MARRTAPRRDAGVVARSLSKAGAIPSWSDRPWLLSVGLLLSTAQEMQL